jgi:hypothetical protein
VDHFSLPAGFKATYMKLQKEEVSIKQHIRFLPTTWENNPVQPLGRLNPRPPAKLKNINSEL